MYKPPSEREGTSSSGTHLTGLQRHLASAECKAYTSLSKKRHLLQVELDLTKSEENQTQNTKCHRLTSMSFTSAGATICVIGAFVGMGGPAAATAGKKSNKQTTLIISYLFSIL